MKPLKTLVVGCGLIARSKHLPALTAESRRVDLVAVCDTQESLARQASKAFKVPRVYTALPEALRETRPDLVVLCTPPGTHRDLAVETLRGGAHLLLEKPMALTPEDCRQILAAAEENRRKLCVSFSQSFTPVVCRAQSVIQSGRIGPLLGMNIFLSTPADYMTNQEKHWVHRLPGGFLSETGPHVAHMALRFLGKIRGTHLTARKHTSHPWVPADDLRIQFDCERGLCSAQLLYTTDHWAARVDLIGKSGRLRMDLESGLLTLHQRNRLTPLGVIGSQASEAAQILWETVSAGAAYLSGRRRSGHQTLLSLFLTSLQNNGPLPTPPEDGLLVAEAVQGLIRQLPPTPAG